MAVTSRLGTPLALCPGPHAVARSAFSILLAGAFGVILPPLLPPVLAPQALAACDPDFLSRVDRGLLQAVELNEASGLAASRRNPGVYWCHNDSGDSNRIFALNDQGEHLGIYRISGATNRDWEDISTGPGPDEGRSYLYIGEIGDNNAVYGTKYIYRVPEPAVAPDQAPTDTTLTGVETIAFQYPDGPRDAETLMVDPLTRDIYVVSKREEAVRVYCAQYPQPVGPVITLEPVGTLPLTLITAGDISPSGREVLLKSYSQVFYWCREEGETVADALSAAPALLPYTAEPQGEAIAWDANGVNYYTTSEEPAGIPAHLYLYPRDPTSSVGAGSGPRGDGRGRPRDRYELPPPLSAPNPFREATQARFSLPRPAHVRLEVVAADGRHVRSLIDGWQSAGQRWLLWDGRDDAGRAIPAGLYYYSLRTDDGSRPGRVVRVR